MNSFKLLVFITKFRIRDCFVPRSDGFRASLLPLVVGLTTSLRTRLRVKQSLKIKNYKKIKRIQ